MDKPKTGFMLKGNPKLGGNKLAFSLKAKPKLVNNPLALALNEDDDDVEDAVKARDAKRQKMAGAPPQRSVASAVPAVLPPQPSDPEVQKVADKLAAFVAKHGRNIENVTRQRNPGDTPFRFLLDASCADYKYYEFKIKEAEAALAKDSPAATPAPAAAVPPLSSVKPAPRAAQQESAHYRHQLVPVASSPAGSASEPSGSAQVRRSRFSDAPRDDDGSAARKREADSLKLMEYYMQKAAQQESYRPPRQDTNEMPPPEALNVAEPPSLRGHHMGDFIPEEELQAFMSKCTDAQAAVYSQQAADRARIQADNVGHKLLSKMGWKEGSGLGAKPGGIVNPIGAEGVKGNNLGIGAAATHEVSSEDDIYEQYKKRMMLGYKHRPNPLNNPRKAYY